MSFFGEQSAEWIGSGDVPLTPFEMMGSPRRRAPLWLRRLGFRCPAGRFEPLEELAAERMTSGVAAAGEPVMTGRIRRNFGEVLGVR